MARLLAETLILTSGKQIKLRGGTFAIYPTLEITDAYNSKIFYFDTDSIRHKDLEQVANPLSLMEEDLHEIAEYMISLWMGFKENLRSVGSSNPAVFRLDTKEG